MIVAVAADEQHLKNFCKWENIDRGKFVFADNKKKLMGIGRGYSYVVISEPYNYRDWHEMQIEFRIDRANRLPLDINQWPLTEFA